MEWLILFLRRYEKYPLICKRTKSLSPILSYTTKNQQIRKKVFVNFLNSTGEQ